MHVSIFSINNTLFDGQAEKVIAKTSVGEIAVIDGHVPLISSLAGAVEVVSEDGTKNNINLSGGFIEVRPNSEVVILSNE